VTQCTDKDRRIGRYSAISVLVISVMYTLTGLIGVVERPSHSAPLRQVDPYLAILEYFIILAAAALVVLMAAIYAYAPANRKTYALAALAFMIGFATLTCGVHFVALTVVRQLDPNVAPQLLRQLSFETDWPNLVLTLDLLAWDFFFGLSMLFASRVFSGSGLHDKVRASMSLSGILCVLATLGPLTGKMRIPWLGIVGYAFVLPITCVFLFMLFGSDAES
jgi:hypothetical protein